MPLSRMGKPSSALAVQHPACKEKRDSSTAAAGSVVIKNSGVSGPTPMNAPKLLEHGTVIKLLHLTLSLVLGMPKLWEKVLTLKSKLELRKGRGGSSLALPS